MPRTTRNAIKILHNRLYKDPERKADLEEARINDDVARKIAALREARNLSQRELAALVGTTASVICRLEDADYEGHSVGMLNRIASALGAHLSINFVPAPDGGAADVSNLPTSL
ncbi:MAG: XRE family transcriptional regulator [Chroococcidiopsidaceae cyanobacterium CP_BM_RX_35]|nr:XRE family transcriptional regulator [Chroococcidiopsidaceae cyanobacterium CP_BM_RX_35]